MIRSTVGLRHQVCRSFLGIAVCLAWFIPAEAEETPIQRPVVVAAVRGVDRLLESVDQIFDASGNGRYAQILRGFVANLNNLNGVDRGRPFGIMAFAPKQIGGQPEFAFFVPVASVADLKASIRLGNVISLEDGASSDRLGFKTPEKTIPVRLAHGYAFLSEQEGTINQNLPDPSGSMDELLKSYDAVVTFRRDGLPDGLFNIGKSTLEALAAHGVPRESGESDADYELKKEVAGLGFDVLRSLMSDVEQINIGWKLAPDARSLSVEANVVLRSDGTVSPVLRDLVATPPRFAPIAAEPSPLAIVYHVSLPARVKGILGGILSRLSDRASHDLKNEAAALAPHVMSTLDSLRKTLDAGQVDGFVQVVGGPPDHFYAVGGLSLVSAGQVAEALRAVLPYAGDQPNEPKVEMDALKIQDTAFHRIANIKQRPQDRLLYGDDVALLVGVGREAVWFGFGGDQTAKHLAETLEAPNRSTNGSEPALVRIRFHLTDWLGMIGEDADQDARNFRQIAQRAFPEPEDDKLDFTISPTPSGLRLRLEIEQGYLRLIGHTISAAQQAK